MKFTYDPRLNIAYLHLREKIAKVESLKLSDELVLDIAANGKIYGIEFLNANEQLKADMSRLLLINEATGEKAEIDLPISKA